MRAKPWFAILVVIILAAFAIAIQAGAETITAKGRDVFQKIDGKPYSGKAASK